MSAKIIIYFIRLALKLTGSHRESWTRALLSETIAPVVLVNLNNGDDLKILCMGTRVINRASRVMSKEPETIDWLDSMVSDDVLWDVGANCGIYTLYAAKKCNVTVVAFEPVAGNYHNLMRNIYLNNLADKVSAYCIALLDKTGSTDILLSSESVGAAEHVVGTDHPDDETASKMSRQSALTYPIDSMAADTATPFPNHIKIDVDGGERKVLDGAAQTLRDPRLKSVLIETYGDREYFNRLFSEYGFQQSGSGRLNIIYTRPSRS